MTPRLNCALACPCSARPAVPPDGFRGVLRHAQAVGVDDSEVELRLGDALLGGQAVPPDGFRGVLRHAQAVGVDESEVELRLGDALLGGQAVPPDGFRGVLQDALTGAVRGAEG